MWTSGWENTSTGAGIKRQERSPYADLLLERFAEKGLLPNESSSPYIKLRMELFGSTEWLGIQSLGPLGISPDYAAKLLGWGFATTQFLIAPVISRNVNRIHICSLGALMNLLIVASDRLLEAGATVEEILPRAEITAGGGTNSPVMLLLLRYSEGLRAAVPDGHVLRTIQKTIPRMFEAEIQTVWQMDSLSYRFWLLKSSLPFVLMALPAWGQNSNTPAVSYLSHVNWLYRLGRFIGAIDDAADYFEDELAGEPNIWHRHEESVRPALASRISEWGKKLLDDWDSFVPRTSPTDVYREVFLHMIWGWLETSNGQSHAE